MSDTAIAEPTSHPTQNRFRTIDQRAEELGVHGDTLRSIIKKGKGPKVRRIAAKRLGISDRDWNEWLESREVDPSEVGK